MKVGPFAAAGGGTPFLDEIGETSPAVRVKLLRALQEGTVRPVGATRDIEVDARIVPAIHRDLDAMVRTLAEAERRHVLAVLERMGGRRERTARALGIGESTLWRRLREPGGIRGRRARGGPGARKE